MGPVAKNASRFVVLVALYLAGAWLTTWFIERPDQVTLIWPPAGLAYAALLLYGIRWWPFIAVSLLLLHSFLNPVPPLFVAFSIAANVLGAVGGAAFVHKFSPLATSTHSVRAGFTLLRGGLLLVLVSGSIGVSGLIAARMVHEDQAFGAFAQWAMSDLFGLVTVTPLMLIAVKWRLPEHPPSTLRYGDAREHAAWGFALLLSLVAVYFAGNAAHEYSLGAACLPLALSLWAALRFEPVWAYAATLLLALFIVTVTGLGVAGFTPPSNVLEGVILTGFLSVAAIIPQIVSAAIHENRLAAHHLIKRATTDPLTGLPNRGAFEQIVRHALIEHDAPELALAYVDLDQFKIVNDTVSHAAGDELIRSLAGVLRAELASGDQLARLGGDEFALLMRATPAEAEARAKRLVEVIGAYRFAHENHVIAPSTSIGLVVFRAGDIDFGALLTLADAACFTAKELGGNRLQLARPGDRELEARTEAMRWAMRLSDAIDHDRFLLHCQSIAPLREAAHEGQRHFEVLLRMHDPATGEVLPPGSFVAAAERFKLGVRLDQHVVDRTLAWLEAHPEALAATELCSINLTAAAVESEEFAAFVQARLKSSVVPAHKLCFEVTETSAVRDLARAQRFIQSVRALGCRFALDDFGAGFCSFAYLKTLDVDYFKIDGSFVREVATSPLALAIVRSIAEIARVMRKQTIAEFAETESIRQHLIALGVDYAQGYAIDRPMPIAEYFAAPPPVALRAAS